MKYILALVCMICLFGNISTANAAWCYNGHRSYQCEPPRPRYPYQYRYHEYHRYDYNPYRHHNDYYYYRR